MEYIFYICGFFSILFTICSITHIEPIHSLLYLIASLLTVSGIFFSLGAYFAGALEIIIYAGAILVLFVFVVMMLNFDKAWREKEKDWITLRMCLGPGFLAFLLFVILSYAILDNPDKGIIFSIIDSKQVGIKLFGPYIVGVELISMLLLSGLIVGYHIGHIPRLSRMSSKNTVFITTKTMNQEK
ncbi:NADH-quinone oxidoreductase subunit J [Candidatus Erwinia haradaeae]|uniref:NADH-quinone oxidoreductase subunit J n=1 Tax=Candidatus Erwinia haradaeae TaxID=1922217 RepID=A0A451D1M3_9GAMM|nr:NADH-quinone oxidoreductase subunit J [Candidatus Erwinia haradaeae]VFP79515.1 NADH-quinone oxidoreductase subunit J [Candidatus Erwinia haradaeae]